MSGLGERSALSTLARVQFSERLVQSSDMESYFTPVSLHVLKNRILGYIEQLQKHPRADVDALFVLKRLLNDEQHLRPSKRGRKPKST
jgi:hypothetical protein